MNEKTELTENPVFKELVKTETSYVTSLRFLSSALHNIQLAHGKDPFFGQLQTLVGQLIGISDGLSSNVQDSLKNIDNTELRKTLQGQRNLLLKEFFKTYQSYKKLYDHYIGLCKANPKRFELINSEMVNDSKLNPKGLNFESHAIMPIQRGLRYFLLLHEIMKQNQGCDEFNKEDFAQLEELFKDALSEYSTKTSQKRPYQFGDYTRALFGIKKDVESESKKQATPSPSPTIAHKGYKFGDITRRLLGGAKANQGGQTTAVASPVKTVPTKSGNTPTTAGEEKAAPVVLHQSLSSLPPSHQLAALMRESLLKPDPKLRQTPAVVSSVNTSQAKQETPVVFRFNGAE